MAPAFSIITPTIGRSTLWRCLQSVDSQDFKDWQHIVTVDTDTFPIPNEITPGRAWIRCPESHGDYGNSCRYWAHWICAGDYILYLDDDDCWSDNQVLSRIAKTIKEAEKPPVWLLAPIIHNGILLPGEPKINHCGTPMLVHLRKFNNVPIKFPSSPHYTADGEFCEDLLCKYGPPTIVQGPPIMNQITNHGLLI